MSEMFADAYREGLAFIHDVRRGGWAAVESLFKDHPPASTEQILHPEKWRKRERPVRIHWPTLTQNPLLADWRLLGEGVLGELQWRIIFDVQGLANEAADAAAGRAGDRYAVFENNGGETLLLLYTTWDSESDAKEFSKAYERVLSRKHEGTSPAVPTQIRRNGLDVVTVEGGRAPSLDAFMSLAESADVAR
jgi:hypothetical protein